MGMKLTGNVISFYIVPLNPAYCGIGEELQVRRELNLRVAGVYRPLSRGGARISRKPEDQTKNSFSDRQSVNNVIFLKNLSELS